MSYSIGVDLGTSNSAVARVDLAEGLGEVLPLTQLARPGAFFERDTLPSAFYIPTEQESADGQLELPWVQEAEVVIGQYARDRAAEVPDRVITSAKSWLCNGHVDRRAEILPWRSDVSKLWSPFDVSRLYLRHLLSAARYSLERQGADTSPLEQEVVLTVPASFDEVARNLTHSAAQEAGWGDVTLLEEPLAAVYAWIQQKGDNWRESIQPGDLVLVCDVGGGTADFTLVAVSEEGGDLQLDRLSVGDHILLGGDNMDLALAFHLKQKLEQGGDKLDRWQLLSLVHSARGAKEQLFGDESVDEVSVSLAGKGASLFASTLSTVLTRAELHTVVVDGFVPRTAITDMPKERPSVGLKEVGLPYANDPALSRHLARFLVRSLENVGSDRRLSELVPHFQECETVGFMKPTHILFNGGVFHAAPLRERVRELLSEWSEREVVELDGRELDLAVARGAAAYGAIRASGKGLRIRAGTVRSYYIGLETSMPAVPGMLPPVKGLCIVPQGMEEGSSYVIEDQEFGLVTGQPVEFRFFSSAIRAGDAPGLILDDVDQLQESSRLEVTLPAESDGPAVVPVRLDVSVTEVGILELWMHHTQSDRRWRLEFNVRAMN